MSASTTIEPSFQDDALSLVQAYDAVSNTILGAGEPAEVLRAFHEFTGRQFSSGQLARTDEADEWRVVAEGTADDVRPADRRVTPADLPGGERLAAHPLLFVADTDADDALSESERARLKERGVRAVLTVPLQADGRMTGVLTLSHSGAVRLSPARLRAVRTLADQYATFQTQRHALDTATARATQEETVNALMTRLQSGASVDELLRLAVTELGAAFGATHGAIRLGQPTAETASNAEGRPIHD